MPFDINAEADKILGTAPPPAQGGSLDAQADAILGSDPRDAGKPAPGPFQRAVRAREAAGEPSTSPLRIAGSLGAGAVNTVHFNPAHGHFFFFMSRLAIVIL